MDASAGLVTVALLAGVAFAVNKTVSVIKAIFNKNANTVVSQVLVWVVGIAGVVLMAHAKLSSDLVIPGLGRSLGGLDTSSHVLLGWILGGSGSFAFDFTKAVDNTNTAVEAPLLTPKTP